MFYIFILFLSFLFACPPSPTSAHTDSIPILLLDNIAADDAKSLQSCLTLCDPIDGSPPGSPVSGILQARKLEWLPFPSPMCESEKWKCSCSVVSNSWWPHELQPTRLLCPWNFLGKSTGVGCHCLLHWIILGCLNLCMAFFTILTATKVDQACSSGGIQSQWSICPQLDAQEDTGQYVKTTKR